MTDKVLMAVLVLGLGVIINHIGIDEKDMMGSSVGSFDGTTHGNEGRCGAPILCRCITGRRGGGVARPAQQVGIESTCLHGTDVVIYEIMWKVSEVDPG